MENSDSDQSFEPDAADNNNERPDPVIIKKKMRKTYVHNSYNTTSYQTNTSSYQSSSNNYQSNNQFQGMVNMFADALHFGVGDIRTSKTSENISTAVPKTSENILTAVPKTSENISTAVPKTSENISTAVPKTSENISTAVPKTSENISTAVPKTSENILTAVSKTSENILTAVPDENESDDEAEKVFPKIENIKSCLRSLNIKKAIKESKEVVACIEAVILQEDADYIKPLYYKELDNLIKLFTEIEHIDSVYQLMKCRLTLIQNYFDDSKLNGELVAFTGDLKCLALILCSKNCRNKKKFRQFYPVLEGILEFAEKLEIPNSNIKQGLTSTLLFNYGFVCYHCDDYQKSLQLLQQVINRTANSKELGGDENRFTSFCFAGLSLLNLQRFSKAKPYIEESLSLSKIVLEKENLGEGLVVEITKKCGQALKIIKEEPTKDKDTEDAVEDKDTEDAVEDKDTEDTVEDKDTEDTVKSA